MVNTLQDLRQLLDLMAEKGVVALRLGELELSVAPRFEGPVPEDTDEPEDEKDYWRGMSRQEQIDIGAL